MKDHPNHAHAFFLPVHVHMFFNGTNELRLRKGIWNFEEAVLAMEELGEAHKGCLLRIFNALADGSAVDVEAILDESGLVKAEREQVVDVLGALKGSGYLRCEDDRLSDAVLSTMLGGTVQSEMTQGISANVKPVCFFSDSPSIRAYAKSLAEEIELPLEVMSDNRFREIAATDLTTRYEAYETRSQLDGLRSHLEQYSSFVGCLERPHLAFLRNLNRGLVETSQVLTLALLDGPFTSLFTIKPRETGCFECYEQRLLARLEEMQVYGQFVASTRNTPLLPHKTKANPLLHALTGQALHEAYLVHAIGKAKLAGRVLNTFVPIMEIQVQDLLRIPYCSACGHVAQARMDEMYTSTKKLVDEVLERVTVVA